MDPLDLSEQGRMIVEECKEPPPYRERLQTDHPDLDQRFYDALRKVDILETAPSDKRVRIDRLIERLRTCKRALSTPQRIYGHYLSFKANSACCPFHDEKTPSFRIFKDGGFYCFGCNEHGDIFDFIQKMEGCSLGAAVEIVEKII